jgi:hypothetical protein
MYSLDFTGLCSHNTLNVWISGLVLLILAHAILEIFIILDFDHLVDYTSMITEFWLPMLIFSVYPLILAILSTTTLLQNLLFDPNYPVVCVWHRNSIITLIQNIIYSCLVLDFFCKFLDHQNEIFVPEKLLRVFRPFFILCVLALFMVSIILILFFNR